MNYAASHQPPVFNAPVRWVLRVLAWTAFAVSAYLAWHAASGSSVAACGVGAQNGCDKVLGSSWARWLNGLDVPVAVLGLACYASLAGLSVLLGAQNARAARWINTTFVMLASVAAGASLWFIGIQVFAIRSYCPYCIVADLCGLAIGGVAIGTVIHWQYTTPKFPRPRAADAGLLALRTALPAGATGAAPVRPQIVPAHVSPRPSLAIALSTSIALLAILIVGQIGFPSKTYSLQTGTLDQPVDLAGSSQPGPADQAQASQAQPHVAMRVPSESGLRSASERPSETVPYSDDELFAPDDSDDAPSDDESTIETDASAETTADASSQSDGPQRERLVKFLNGSLTVDVYKHPCIGSPEAPHVMIEMVSYDCSHCRKMHRLMEQGISRYRDQVAILIMPVPLEMSCNKLVTDPKGSHRGACATARLALGIAAISPSSFHRFHNLLMSGDKDKPPVLEKVIPKAYGMVDRDRLREFTRSEEVNKQIAQYVSLFARLRQRPGAAKEFGLPVQILGDHVLSGVVEKDSDVYAAWEEHLGVKVP